MKRNYQHAALAFWFALFLFNSVANAQAIDQRIRSAFEQSGTDVTIENAVAIDSGYQSFLLNIRQPLDHQAPEKGSFLQRVYLSHRSAMAPMVMVHQGYGIVNDRLSEPAKLLKANQIRIEHRFFNKSRPDSLQWQYLTVRQSADDEHRIVRLLKPLYPAGWLNTGISKGGQSALFFRRFYPDDVAATLAYVAPLNLAVEDPRLNEFLKTVGDESCRRRLSDVQRRLLQNRERLIPLLKQWGIDQQDPFIIPVEDAFEYAVLEYTFSFWQYAGISCDSLPGTEVSAQEMFDHLKSVVGLNLFTRSGSESFGPFFYQAYRELGYYSYNTEHLQDLLVAVPQPENATFIPAGADRPQFDQKTMTDIHRWLQEKGNNILYIYGETDAWTATAMTPGAKTNAIKMVKAEGNHSTRIASFSREQQEMMLKTLGDWLSAKKQGEFGWRRGFHLFNSVLMIIVVLLILFFVARRIRANPKSNQT